MRQWKLQQSRLGPIFPNLFKTAAVRSWCLLQNRSFCLGPVIIQLHHNALVVLCDACIFYTFI